MIVGRFFQPASSSFTNLRLHCSSSNAGAAGAAFSSQHQYPIAILEECQQRHVNWDDRLALQATWTAQEKGWQTSVDWRDTPFGVGLFANEPIAAGTVLRVGRNGRNLKQFTSTQDIEDFCSAGCDNGGGNHTTTSTSEYQSRLNYVKDYLWGYSPVADERGYEIPGQESSFSSEDRFFGMWVPGNGLNHREDPNTVYRTLPGGTAEGIVLVALTDIAQDEELFDDYRRHGSAPGWLKTFAKDKAVTLNFAECNDFV